MSTTAYPPSPFLRAIRFWLSFLAGLIGFSVILLLGGYTFRGSFTLQLTAYIFALLFAISWLVWRWFIWRDHLPRTGLEIPIGLGLLAVLLSLAASPDIRQGLWRTGWIISYALIFYILLNLLATDLDRWGLLASAATVTGLALFQADVETLQWYRSWWDASGGANPPGIYRFLGLLTSSTPLMALAVQFTPLILLAVWRLRRPLPRVLAVLWILIYLIAVPFSSSRAGWLGLAVAMAIACVLWALETRPWQTIRKWPRRTQFLVAAGFALIIILAAMIAPRFIVAFASHPTHAGDPFGLSGRDVFWSRAIQIWQASPIFGTGPGRFAFEYLRVEPAIPPGFWPVHAHNIFFEVLAEFGVFGLTACLLLLGSAFYWGWRRWRQSVPQNRGWIAAILAGLSGLLVQLQFDDLTAWMAVVVPAVFLLAWVGSNQSGPLPTFRRISVGWLALPVVLLLAVAGWEIWAYQPFAQWQPAVQSGNWRQAAELASISAQRDPAFHFYHTQAGLLWAWEWEYRKDPAALTQARQHLTTALQIEPSTSWTWANLAVLDSSAGDSDAALQHMRQAVRLSPNYPVFALNLGIIYETLGQTAKATESYRKALNLSPVWASAKFWHQTSLRRESLTGWTSQPQSEAAADPYWQQARRQISAGNLDLAASLLNQASLLYESALEIARTKVLLAESRGESSAAQAARDQIKQLTTLDRMTLDTFVTFTYPAYLSNRDGIGFLAAPGLIPDMDANDPIR